MAGSNSLLKVQYAQMQALLERGATFLGKGKAANALRAFDDAIAINPGSAEAFCCRGNALADLGQLAEAVASYDRAIALDPRLSEAHDFRGAAFALAGEFELALQSVERALLIAPDNFNARNNRANLLREVGRFDEALAEFDLLIAREPAFAAAYSMRARTLAALSRHEEALHSFEKTLALDPHNAEALCNRGTALNFLDRPEEAVEAFEQALALDPGHAEILGNLGAALARVGRLDAAESCFRRCLAGEPGHVDALLGLAGLISRRRGFDEAGRVYQRVLTIDVNNVAALRGLAGALEELGQHRSALICYDHLLSVAPDNAAAHQKRGFLLVSRTHHAEALLSFDRAKALDPALEHSAVRLHAAMHLSKWEDFDAQLDAVRHAAAAGDPGAMPFPVLALADDPALQHRCAQILADSHQQIPATPLSGRYPRHERIRLGYFSADFHHHATMQLFAETLEAHDRDRFELAAFWFGEDMGDQWRSRAKGAFDTFVDVRLKDDAAAAQIARDMEIDIAIDLKGYTQNCRFGIFAERAAPIQVSYLGYPGTSGAAAIDYLFADEVLIRPDARNAISEKIVYLPASYQANASLKPVSRLATRQAVGLPEQGFVFCCFNQNYKITPDIFACWMSILRRAEASVLWLWVNHEPARQNLARNAAELGVDPARIVFAGSEPTERHLDRLQLADLFLDTLPCNAHTTASDALRVGLPILTCPGRSFAARVAASLLTALDLRELVADDLAEYEALAVALAHDPARLAAIRARLIGGRLRSTLFEPPAMARKLEAAYSAIYARHHAGEAPDDIRITA
ncbi:tetratricopeptide repeat protein [Sphingomonas psychrotolerans]|uniref:tetratricopeptide repeat protein n=1 Tax=Sphingomonas psychrotolerans TaxID=1327635 RepID=UPI0013052E3C|nr:tetratricopeptide repeat protein [Sphingomonas psychrotolerans]